MYKLQPRGLCAVGRSFLGDPKVRWRIRYGDRREIVGQGSKYGRFRD
jgi:hypothetical protein